MSAGLSMGLAATGNAEGDGLRAAHPRNVRRVEGAGPR